MIREDDPRFVRLERKIGIFITVAIAGLAIAFYLFGSQKDFFSKKYTLRCTVDRGTGFIKGMPVKLSGFRIGRLTSISLNDQAMVDLSLEIDSKYSKWIRNDSTVKLVKEGLVGDNIIDVAVGSLDKPELKDKDTIIYLKTKGFDEMADEIAEKVKPVLIEVRDIISYINNPDGDLKKSVRNLEVLTRNLDGTRQNADRLLVSAGNNMENITERSTLLLNNVNSKIESIELDTSIKRINNTLDQLDRKLPGLLEKADSTLDNLKGISVETRKMTEKAFPQIPGLLNQAEDVMFSSDRLINTIQNNWLFRSGAQPATNQGFIRGDSYE
jgi:phospholipid/cholesterol/gamma-HCH transport system substrate-binding protein